MRNRISCEVHGMHCLMDRLAFEDGQWGFSTQESLYLWESLHCEGEKEGTVDYGTDMEAEAESGGLTTGVGVMHND